MAETNQGQTGTQQAGQPEVNKDARTWGMLCHLGGLAGFIFPFGNIIAPLVIWLIKKEEHEFVNEQGKEAINFQITLMIAAVVGFILTILIITSCVGIPLLIATGVCNIVFCILGAVKANKGEHYRYPVSIRLIK